MERIYNVYKEILISLRSAYLVLHVFRNYAHQFVSPKDMKEEGKEKLTWFYIPL